MQIKRSFLLIFILQLPFQLGYSLEDLKIGVLTSYSNAKSTGYKYIGAAASAVAYLNNNSTLLNGSKISMVLKDSMCSDIVGLGATMDLYAEDVDVFIGPSCSSACLSGGKVSTYKQIPMISYSCSSIELSNKEIYPYFARTKPYARGSKEWTPKFFVGIMKFSKWKKACLVERQSDIYIPLAAATRDYFLKNDIEILHRVVYFSEDTTFDGFGDIIGKLKNKCRIIFLLTRQSDVTQFIIQAKNLNMLTGYAYITVDYYTRNTWPFHEWGFRNKTGDEVVDYLLAEVLGGLIFASAVGPNETDPNYVNLVNDSKDRLTGPPFYDTRFVNKTFAASTNTGYVFDTIMLYVTAVHNLLEKGGNYKNASLLIETVKNTHITGYTGEVYLDNLGNRIPFFQVTNYQNKTSIIITYYNPLKEFDIAKDKIIIFPGKTKIRPVDEPLCGFNEEKCPKRKEFEYTTVYIILPLVVLILSVVIIYFHNKRKYETSILCKDIIINMSDLTFLGETYRESALSTFTNITRKTSVQNFRKLSQTSEIVICKMKKCYMKTVKRCALELTTEVLLQLKKIKDINQTNVNQFVGICLDGHDVSYIWSYCTKGSLQDVLHNEDIDCDWMFRKSFASDISRGLHEIHSSSIGIHGNLSSQNCLIDNRWVCKLSNFGLENMKGNDKGPPEFPHAYYKNKFWLAPEIINSPTKLTSKSGDIFSYAIILYEIGAREEPYAFEMTDQNLTSNQVVERIRNYENPPFRPKFPPNTGATDLYIHTMSQCWADDPFTRPSAKEVHNIMRMMDKERYKGGLIDHMITLMEKYTTNLEELVAERTMQLQEEKVKTETLLYKMLPISVANKLKEGQPVVAEYFDSVTIFFSDIVGFTALCSESTPLQVVDVLNDLYSCFDHCVDSYDAYKVETIGDAYMVVSGLPIRNGNKHAGEIASMSLDLLSLADHFIIRHRPTQKLQLRIGIHSGSCVSGVVGLKMPRYCLFGDTVNCASRMESTGMPLKIHVSLDCKNLLETLTGYYLVERGLIYMKGKGSAVTYFLEGKNDDIMYQNIQNNSYESMM